MIPHYAKYIYLTEDRPQSLLNAMPEIKTTSNKVILRHCNVQDTHYLAVVPEELSHFIKPSGHDYHEVILLTRPFYFFVDYDEIIPVLKGPLYEHQQPESQCYGLLELIISTVEAYVQEANKIAEEEFLPLISFNRAHIIVLDSSRYYDALTYKYSFHIIFKDLILSSHFQAQVIYNWMLDHGVGHIDNVYGSIRNMRCIYGRKDNTLLLELDTFLQTELKIGKPQSILDTLITVLDPILFKCALESTLITQVNAPHLGINNTASLFDNERLRSIIDYLIRERIWNIVEFFQFGTCNKFIRLDRIKPGECLICERQHDKDNAWLSFYMDRRGTIVRFHCYRNSKEYREHVIEHDELTPITTMLTQTQLETLINRIGILSKLAQREYEIHHSISMSMKDFMLDLTYPVTFIRAGTGSGKTTALIKCVTEQAQLNDKFSMIALSFRKTFTADFARRFTDLELKTYEQIQGCIAIPHIVIQVDSINRLDMNYYRDREVLLVLDEIMAILKHMMTSQYLASRPHTIDPFITLLQRSKWCVIMDAYLRQEHVQILSQYLCSPDQLPRIIVDPYNSDKDNLFIFYNTYASIITRALEIAIQEPILVCCSTLRDAEMVRMAMLEYGDFNSEDVMLYAGKGKINRATLFEHFTNVDHYWSLYPVVIFTPTLTCGVSSILDRNHMFGLFDFMSPYMPAEECMQMLKRNRTIRTFHLFMKARGTILFDAPFNYNYYLSLTKCEYVGHYSTRFQTKYDIAIDSNPGLNMVFDLYNVSQYVQARTNLNPIAALMKCILLYGGIIELVEDDYTLNSDLITKKDINDLQQEARIALVQYIFIGGNPEALKLRRYYENLYNIIFISPAHLQLYARRDIVQIFTNLTNLLAANPHDIYKMQQNLLDLEATEKRIKLHWLCTYDWIANFYLIYGILKYLGFEHIFMHHCEPNLSEEVIEKLVDILIIRYYKKIIINPRNHSIRGNNIKWNLVRKELRSKWGSKIKRMLAEHGLIINSRYNTLTFSPLFELSWAHFSTGNLNVASYLIPPYLKSKTILHGPLPIIKIGEALFSMLVQNSNNNKTQDAFYQQINTYITKAYDLLTKN